MALKENIHDVPAGSEALLGFRADCCPCLTDFTVETASLTCKVLLCKATLREIVMHHLRSHGLLAMQHAIQACQHMHTVQDTVKLKIPISYSTSLRLSIPHSAQQPIANPIKRQSAFASVFIQFPG